MLTRKHLHTPGGVEGGGDSFKIPSLQWSGVPDSPGGVVILAEAMRWEFLLTGASSTLSQSFSCSL